MRGTDDGNDIAYKHACAFVGVVCSVISTISCLHLLCSSTSSALYLLPASLPFSTMLIITSLFGHTIIAIQQQHGRESAGCRLLDTNKRRVEFVVERNYVWLSHLRHLSCLPAC